MLLYDLLAYIGRFQPYHLGHELTIKEGLKLAERLVILVGSSNQPRTPKNPWTFDERVQMIKGSLTADEVSRVSFEPLRDRPYNEDGWIEGVQRAIHKNRNGAKRVSLIGYTKDESSYYLKKFPQFGHVESPVKETINATDLREAYFKRHFMAGAPLYVPSNVLEYLKEFEQTEDYAYVLNEQKYLDQHAKDWAFAPYDVPFAAGDTVVTQSGHILLIQRIKAPGKGLWALPGGHLNLKTHINKKGELIKADMTFLDAAIRELVEETQIDVMESILRARVKEQKLFMHPERSLRGRYITEAAYIALEQHGKGLPKVKGTDDALVAKWFTFSEFRKMEPFMFEDHFHIGCYFIDRGNF